MSPSNLIRWSGLAALGAGVLLVIVDIAGLWIFSGDFSEIATTGFYAFIATISLILGMLLPLGLVGLYARQSETAGPLGLAGFLVAFAGTMLVVGFFWASAFIAPALADVAPEFLDEGPPPGLMLSFILFALGWLLFGFATLRARVYPHIAAILLMVGAVLSLLPLPLSGLVFDVAVAWLGLALFTGRGATVEQPTTRVS